MSLDIEIAGRPPLHLTHVVVLDVNGTLTDRGRLVVGVADRLAILARQLVPQLLSADTFGNAAAIADALGVEFIRVPDGDAKESHIRSLGANGCAAIGNGRNDAAMLGAAGLGIAVIGPEGAHATAIAAADLVTAAITDALALLTAPQTLVATLRP